MALLQDAQSQHAEANQGQCIMTLQQAEKIVRQGSGATWGLSTEYQRLSGCLCSVEHDADDRDVWRWADSSEGAAHCV